MALIGFDDMEKGRFTDPPLISVSQPLELQGREAMRLALHQLEQEVPIVVGRAGISPLRRSIHPWRVHDSDGG